MNPAHLAWYTCGVAILFVVLISSMSFVPGHESFRDAMLAAGGLSAAAFGGLGGYLGSRPKDHWVRRSNALAWALMTVAVLATAMVFLLALG
jgi:hypothetical protein